MVRVKTILLFAALAAFSAGGQSIWDFVDDSPRPKRTSRTPNNISKAPIPVIEKVVTNTVEVVKVERIEVEKPVTNVVEVVKVEPVIETVVTNTVEVVKVERVEVEKPVTNVVEVVKVERVEVEKPVTNVVEVVKVERIEVEKPVTSIVEKVVYDRSVEMNLVHEKEALEQRNADLEAQYTNLVARLETVTRELQEERSRRERLDRVVNGGSKPTAKPGRPARITSRSTNYDRKRGVVLFNGNVHVDDVNYQMHADKAYVFTEGTNDIRRIVAVGNVALTNEARRAYGGKVSYYRKDGMIVLYAGDGTPAEIRDESKAEDRTVRGSKIKFWLNSEQVEVLDATLMGPADSAGGNLGIVR